MRKVREILRMRWQLDLWTREIARSVDVAHSTVGMVLRRAEEAGLRWPVPENIDDEALRRLLYRRRSRGQSKPLPDWQWVYRELKSKIVTLQQLWFEYMEDHPDGYAYSQFCNLYRSWRKKLDLVMRQNHRAGEKAFVDYAGSTVSVVDPETGEIREAQIFVCVLGASNYTYAEATWSQDLFCWTGSHCRAFEFFTGVPAVVIPEYVPRNIFRALCLGFILFRRIKRHWEGVLNWFNGRLTTGLLEGFSSLIQAAKARARGYRTNRNLITMAYLIAGKLNCGLPTQNSEEPKIQYYLRRRL